MSELKSYDLVDIQDYRGEVYRKSEADKVIAELKKERDWLAKDRAQAYDDLEKRAQLNIKQDAAIAELKEQVHDYAQGLYVLQARAEKEARHQKYKWCLAMAEWCKARYDAEDAKVNGCGASWEYISKEMKYWERWRWRWLGLADEPTWAKFLQLIHNEAK